MARPRSFNRTDVLETTMELFWENGFERTSMAEISGETGLDPGSLYHAFGDKRTLFEQAVEFYSDEVMQERLQHLRSPAPLRDRCDSFLDEVIQQSVHASRISGCLLTNSCLEGKIDDGLQETVETSMRRLRDEFANQFRKARSSGVLRLDVEPGELAEYFLSITCGMNVLGRLFEREDQLRAIKSGALETLDEHLVE